MSRVSVFVLEEGQSTEGPRWWWEKFVLML